MGQSHQHNVDTSKTILWVIVSLAGYFCFLVLPKRLQEMSYFDWVVTGQRMHYCLWLWPAYGILRFLVMYSCPWMTPESAAIATCTTAALIICSATYEIHSKWVLSEHAKGRRPRDRRRLYPIDVPVIPMETWMLLWSLGFATCFAFVNGYGVLLNELFPVCVGILLMYIIVLP